MHNSQVVQDQFSIAYPELLYNTDPSGHICLQESQLMQEKLISSSSFMFFFSKSSIILL